jgi:hypothetical protein
MSIKYGQDIFGLADLRFNLEETTTLKTEK